MNKKTKILLILFCIILFIVFIFIPIFKSKAYTIDWNELADYNRNTLEVLQNPRSMWNILATKINSTFGTNLPVTGGDLLGTLLAPMLPESKGFPFDAQQALMTVLIYGQQMSFIIPWKLIFICLGIVLSWDFLFMVFRMAKWIIGVARGGS